MAFINRTQSYKDTLLELIPKFNENRRQENRDLIDVNLITDPVTDRTTRQFRKLPKNYLTRQEIWTVVMTWLMEADLKELAEYPLYEQLLRLQKKFVGSGIPVDRFAKGIVVSHKKSASNIKRMIQLSTWQSYSYLWYFFDDDKPESVCKELLNDGLGDVTPEP